MNLHQNYSFRQLGFTDFVRLKINKVGGFTLIELIVVMTLITIMLGFAAPQLRSALFVDGTKKTSRWLMITIPSIKTKAIREQQLMVLGISIDEDNLWVVDPQPLKKEKNDMEGNEEDVEDLEDFGEPPKKQKIFKLPSDVHIMDVEFPNQDRISVGETEIYFYPKGHSDHAIIHLEDSDGHRFSFLIEPFLPNIKRIDNYVRF
jgi:prepilin-type N-terminal cleavage/methylation domain-containing protein